MLQGCIADPTVVECKMDAVDCKCECRTSVDNPASLNIRR